VFSEEFLLAATASISLVPFAALWRLHWLTILRMVLLLFIVDMIMTIEAAFYSDIFLIAVLHVITIPAFFFLIYLDLVKQHRDQFRCFICAKQILNDQETETVRRHRLGKPTSVLCHKYCVTIKDQEKKKISQREFRRGIPE
jgi:hypothetical protein